jgi:hypothetical protein
MVCAGMSRDVSPAMIRVILVITLLVIAVLGYRYFAEPKITSLPPMSAEPGAFTPGVRK